MKMRESPDKDRQNDSCTEISTPSAYVWEHAAALLTTFLLIAMTMTIFQIAKVILFPGITVWQSHIATIVFSSITAVVIMHPILRKFQRLRISEMDARCEAERNALILQRSLLPHIPTTADGCRIATRYTPGPAGIEIGGDFYDLARTNHGEISIMIGDVSGKGLSAAALAVAARNTVNAITFETPSPGIVLAHTDTLLSAYQFELNLDSFITICLLILNPQTGNIRYANAGHPAAAILRVEGSVEFLASGQRPLGTIHIDEYTESKAHLDIGDKLILYTDGISEARCDFEMFGLEGVGRVLGNCGQLTPDEVVNELWMAAHEWAHEELNDDIAIVVIERIADNNG